VHVWDLAAAHVTALTSFDAILGDSTSVAINLGTGTGTTVRELVAAFNSVVDEPVAAIDAPRRPGDVIGAFTRGDRAKRLLDWEPRYTVAEGIADSLRWSEVRDAVLAE
jgi:UDP-glucose 4-epimerase